MATKKTIKTPLTLETFKHDNAKCKNISTAEYQSVKVPDEQEPGSSSQTVMSCTEGGPLRSQLVISKGRGGRRYIPYAFTELGVAMLSGLLRS